MTWKCKLSVRAIHGLTRSEWELAKNHKITRFKELDIESTVGNHNSKTNKYSESSDDRVRSFKSYNPAIAALLASLKACGGSKDLQKGSEVHLDAVSSGYASDMYVATALVDMYANCGNLAEARKVFDNMPRRDVVSWNALILGCVENGQSELALELFDCMQTKSCVPNARTYVAALMAYAQLATKEEGMEVEGKLLKISCLRNGVGIYSQAGNQANVFVATAMVDLCAKCGSMSEARKVFNSIRRPDVGLWNALILGYVDNGENELALQLFSGMRQGSNSRTYLAALMACGNLAAGEEAVKLDGRLLKVNSLRSVMALHSQASRNGYETDIFVANCLVDMYAKCGDMVESRRVFDRMLQRTVVSWTALMVGYVDCDEPELALEMFSRMGSEEGCEADDRALAAALMACADLAPKEAGRNVDGKWTKLQCLEKGMAIHSQLSDSAHIMTGTALIDVYARCGSMVDAESVFQRMHSHDVVSWNALIAGYVDNSEPELALEIYKRMRTEGCCGPNATTFTIVLSSCARLAADEEGKLIDGKFVRVKRLEEGMKIHSEARAENCDCDIYVAGALVDLYAQCGSLTDAWRVFFDSMPFHNAVSWTVMILGYVDNGEPQLALELFTQMQAEGSSPRPQTYAVLLKASASTHDLATGKALHAGICRIGFVDDQFLESSLMEVYGRCGSVVDAQLVFDSAAAAKDCACWNSLIASYSHRADSKRVFELFGRMQEEGVEANGGTFVSVLAACSHAGLVERGRKYFDAMQGKYGVDPRIEHYNCVIDMLGRANELDEAVEMVKMMPFEANALTWRTLLGASQTWKNASVGKFAFDSLVRVDEKGPAAYVLMANIYGGESEGGRRANPEKNLS